MLGRFVKAADMTEIGIHDLRHKHASPPTENGVNIGSISECSGHSSVVMTLGTYSYLVPSMQREGAYKLGVVLFGTADTTAQSRP